MKRILSYTLLVASCINASAGLAEESALTRMSVQQRLERIERLTSSDVMMEQQQQMTTMRDEVASLRSLIEQLQYEMDTLKQRQRSLYLDMDRRLTNLEAGAANVSQSPVPAPNTAGSAYVPVPTSTSGATQVAAGDAKQAYSSAFELLKEGRYAQSIEAFSQFMRTYPTSQYMDNAQYWLAEANYVSRSYKTALAEFKKLIANYPSSTKLPGARLKIGYVYYELKNWDEARQELNQVVKLYPNTTVAKKANERLARMKREGR